MNRILDDIVPLSFVAVVALFWVGAGWLIVTSWDQTQKRFEQCIAADKQWVRGTCVR